jgi:ABC-type nitrate/sulfonate/bicarbonate transport system permease component
MHRRPITKSPQLAFGRSDLSLPTQVVLSWMMISSAIAMSTCNWSPPFATSGNFGRKALCSELRGEDQVWTTLTSVLFGFFLGFQDRAGETDGERGRWS